MPSYLSEMDVKLDLMRDMFDAIPRAMCKRLARDMKGCFVEAVVSTFYRELRGDESAEERGVTRRHRMRKARTNAALGSVWICIIKDAPCIMAETGKNSNRTIDARLNKDCTDTGI